MTDTTTAQVANGKMLHNLPDELLNQPRWFLTGGNNPSKNYAFDPKMPVIKAWTNPENQRHLSDIKFNDARQMAGFDIVGHGIADDYLILDFDNVLDDNGNFVNETAEKWFNFVMSTADTYCELSVSRHGFHFVFKPHPTEFLDMAGGKYILPLDDNNPDVKIEIYFKTGGKYFLFTGNVYDCAPKTPITEDCSVVDEILVRIADITPITPRTSTDSPNMPPRRFYADVALVRRALDFIPCPNKHEDYNLWYKVGMILKDNGNPIEDWLKWSADSDCYNEKECRTKWKGFTPRDYLNVYYIRRRSKKFGFTFPVYERSKIDKNKKMPYDTVHNNNKYERGSSANSYCHFTGNEGKSQAPPFEKEFDNMREGLLTTAQAAELLGVAPSTMRQWRRRKIFGVPIFPADIKINGAWFYYRERIEQLKEVYHERTLQSLIRIVKKDREKVKEFDFCVTSAEMANLKDINLDVDDAAAILGVTARQVRNYVKEDKLKWDIEHDGQYWFTAENVHNFKAQRDRTDGTADSEIETIANELAGINDKLKTFDAEKTAAAEKLKAVADFDSDSVFADDIVKAAALCDNRKIYSEFLRDMRNFGKKNPDVKADARAWEETVKEKRNDLYTENAKMQARYRELQALQQEIQNPAPADENSDAQVYSTTKSAISSCPVDLFIPAGYTFDKDGIYNNFTPITSTPLVITAILADEDTGNEFVQLAYYQSVAKKWTDGIIVSSRVIADYVRIIELAEKGIDIDRERAKKISPFLCSMKSFWRNYDRIPRGVLHNRFGWKGNEFISPYDETVNFSPTVTMANHFKVHGDYTIWLGIVKRVFESSPVARFIFSAAVASLLLEKIGCRIFGVYLRAKSKCGKSAAFKLAASIFGDKKFMRSFNSTEKALTGLMLEMSPFPVIVDEFQAADKNFDISRFMYRATEGQERGRCDRNTGRLQDTDDWYNIVLANGEVSLTEDAKTQGIFNRNLELFFRGDQILDRDLAREIHRKCVKTYGHAGKILIEKLVTADFDELEENFNELSLKLQKNFTGYLEEHYDYIAAVTVADALFQKYCLDISEKIALKNAVANAAQIFPLLDSKTALSDVENEKAWFTDWLNANDAHFQTYDPAQKMAQPRFGWKERDAVYIIPTMLKDAVKNAGMSYSKFLSDLADIGVFQKFGKNIYAQKWFDGKNSRYLVHKLDRESADEELKEVAHLQDTPMC